MAKSSRAYKSAKRSKELDRLRKQEAKRLRRQSKIKSEIEPGVEPASGESSSGEGPTSGA
ncbi:MAG: hypothetical protein A2Y69_00200 [Candidatus Aminicenantes bacterium RBG_13_59_9]|nr:MAG: hypothetical protein A2Y69_00200 [Candidatus Aminicenantes bacterium RBG_13_59_9]